MKKITQATLKSFIKKNISILYVCKRADFDAIQDCVVYDNKGFKPAQLTEEYKKYNLGIQGIWLVDVGRNYFEHFENDDFIGIEI